MYINVIFREKRYDICVSKKYIPKYLEREFLTKAVPIVGWEETEGGAKKFS